MNTRKHLSVFAAVLLSTPAALLAQSATQHDAHQGHGALQIPKTPEERAKMADKTFDKIDTDHNGVISRAEFLAHHRDMKMDHGRMDHAGHGAGANPAFAKLDVNKDGKLSKTEMAKHPMAGHFSMMDANKDGFLSPAEFASH